MDYHPVVGRITTLLSERGVWYETFEHEAVRTSEEAAAVRTGYTLTQGAKALIVRVRHKERGKHFAMFVLPGSARFVEAAVREEFGFSDVRFATETEVAELTGGVLPGGVPPFGNLFGLPVYVDESLLVHEKIIFNAGDRSFSVGMLARDFATLVAPVRGNFANT